MRGTAISASWACGYKHPLRAPPPSIVVALTVQRVFSVVWPHRIHVLCTRTKARNVTGGITAASLIFLADVPYAYDVIDTGNITRGRCGRGFPAYASLNANVWLVVESVTITLLPFAVSGRRQRSPRSEAGGVGRGSWSHPGDRSHLEAPQRPQEESFVHHRDRDGGVLGVRGP